MPRTCGSKTIDVDKLRALVNGCSFSRGPIAWPYFLQTVDQSNLTNLACAGAGNTYIHETTVSALAEWPWYDIVLIMWSGIERVDMKIAEPDQFDLSRYTSRYQSQQNDWAEKIIEPVNDQESVEKDWIFGCGHYNGESAMRGSQAFDAVYRYQDFLQFEYGFLQKVIALQNTLKQMQLPYVFTFYQNYIERLQKHTALCKMIDWHCCYIDDNISDITEKNNWFDTDGLHPGIQANRVWAEKLDNFIQGTINA